MPYCPTCGAESSPEADRCSSCGSSLGGTDQNTTGKDSGWNDLVFGFVGGLFAFASGFVLTALFSATNENRELVEELLESSGPAGVSVSRLLPEWYQVIGWEFLENHQVPVSVSVGEAFSSGDWIGEYADLLLPPASELQVVPPLLLVAAGFLVAWRRPQTSLGGAASAGATVVAGYLPGIVVVTYVSTFEVVLLGEVVLFEVSPALGRAILLAGVAYPVFFGGLGGVLAFFLDRS